MGGAASKEYLYSAIEADDVENARKIIQMNKTWVNEPMTNDCKSLPINRAVWRSNKAMIKMLHEEGANINLEGERNEPALMTACKRGNLEIVQYLIELGADIKYVNKLEGNFSPLDLAIAHGNYSVAHFLASKGLNPHSAKTYEDYREINTLNYCDYEGFLQHLKNGVAPDMAPAFHIRPYNPKKWSDPVIDPRETWGQWVNRMIEFQDPPLVERSELPSELRPENRFWGKFRSVINGQNPYPKQKAETWIEKATKQEPKESPAEKNALIDSILLQNLPQGGEPEEEKKVDNEKLIKIV